MIALFLLDQAFRKQKLLISILSGEIACQSTVRFELFVRLTKLFKVLGDSLKCNLKLKQQNYILVCIPHNLTKNRFKIGIRKKLNRYLSYSHDEEFQFHSLATPECAVIKLIKIPTITLPQENTKIVLLRSGVLCVPTRTFCLASLLVAVFNSPDDICIMRSSVPASRCSGTLL